MQTSLTDTISPLNESIDSRSGILFTVFCILTFLHLGRPQDIFISLGVFRPVLLTSILTLILFLMHYNEYSDRPLFQEPQVKLYTALICIMIIGIPFSLYMGLSFRLIFYEYINIFVFFYIFFKVVNSVKKVNDVLLLGCLGNGLYTVFAVLTGTFTEGRLCFGGMYDPNDLAYFTISFLPLNLIFISRNNPLWVRCACIGSFGVGTLLLLLTGSRGGLLAFGVVALMFMFLKTSVIKPAMKISFVLLCLLFFAFAPINIERYQTLLNLKKDYNLSDEGGRIAIWTIGVKTILANPITGVGVGCFSQAVGMDRVRRGLLRQNWQGAHNSVVQIGAETGIIGLLMFLLMSINVFRVFNRTRKKSTASMDLRKIGEMGMVGFIGLFIAGLFLSQAYSTYWVFYVALSAVVNQFPDRAAEEYINVKR